MTEKLSRPAIPVAKKIDGSRAIERKAANAKGTMSEKLMMLKKGQ